MALNAPDIEIVGITTVSGNTPARQVSLNVLRLLKVANRSDVSSHYSTVYSYKPIFYSTMNIRLLVHM